MNSGSLSGTRRLWGQYPSEGPAGSWNGSRGRFSTDEIRLWGFADNQYYGGAGGSKGINTSWAPANTRNTANPFFVFFPGDTGNIVSALSGKIQMTAGLGPFSAIYNSAGSLVHSSNVAGQPSVFQNNTFVTNVPGVATSWLSLLTGVAVTTYVANGAACSLAQGHYDWYTNTYFGAQNSGTLSVPSAASFQAQVQIAQGATVSQYAGLYVKAPQMSGTGAVTAAYGVYVESMAGLAGNTTNYGIYAASKSYLAGTNTVGGAGSNPTPFTITTAGSQPNTTQDVMLYGWNSSGGAAAAAVIKIGPNSASASNVQVWGCSATSSQSASFCLRIPAGWYVAMSTGTVGQWTCNTVGC